MITVKVSSGPSDLAHLLLRQTPGGTGIWGDCRFLVNRPVEKCDWWVVCHVNGLMETETTACDPDHLVFISMEPSDKGTPARFLNRFAALVACDRTIRHPHVIHANGLTWWAGINVVHDGVHHFQAKVNEDYDSFHRMEPPEKTGGMSVISSGKAWTEGQRNRVAFLEKLRAHPVGGRIDFFGEGFTPVLDKLDAILPYKYHIVMENSVLPDYWSEKLADGYLGFALPIYHGCPNIDDYFPPDSLERIDIDDFDKAVEHIGRVLGEDPYETRLAGIKEARSRVLDRYNIFQLMADICDSPARRYRRCTLKTASRMARSWPGRIIHKLRGIHAE